MPELAHVGWPSPGAGVGLWGTVERPSDWKPGAVIVELALGTMWPWEGYLSSSVVSVFF